MLYSNTLNEIATNINTGVEYEIALFYKLSSPEDQSLISPIINKRADKGKINDIIKHTDVKPILSALQKRGLRLYDITFETQNDVVGPSDIVMLVTDGERKFQIGISIKYANTCTLNVTGRRFITDNQITKLKALLPKYTRDYIKEMTELYGSVDNWFRQRKTSQVTDKFIDLIRDEVIENWPNIHDKPTLLSALFHSDSPIEFGVITYNNRGYDLQTEPQTIEEKRAKDVVIGKFQTSYIAFYLDGEMVGRMQVKFNNGFVEKCKRQHADVEHEGVKMNYGQPFTSWNFSVEKRNRSLKSTPSYSTNQFLPKHTLLVADESIYGK